MDKVIKGAQSLEYTERSEESKVIEDDDGHMTISFK